MIKKIKLTITTLLATALFMAPMMLPAVVSAQQVPSAGTASDGTTSPSVSNGLCQGANLQLSADDKATCETNGTAAKDKVNSIITLTINIFSVVVGVAAVIMIIIGGMRYIISGGDSGNVQSAKNTILYAIIGLVVVALAQFVVKFVLGKLVTNP